MTDNRVPRCNITAVLVLATVLATAGFGQTPNPSDILFPCLDDHTFAVVRVDLARIDIEAAFEMAIEVLPESQEKQDLTAMINQGQAQLQDNMKLGQLLAAGVTSGYLLFNTDDLPHVLTAIPVNARSDADQIVDWLEGAFGHSDETLRKGDLILSAPESVLARWKDKPGMRRPDLDRAAAAAKPGAIQAYIAPSTDTRRVAEALLATWPEPKFTVPNGAIVNGLQWATLTVTWPPQLSVELRVEAADPASARVLSETLMSLLNTVKSLPWINQPVANLSNVLASLQPEINGRTLRLTLDKQQATRIIADLVIPPLQMSREVAKQVGLAVLIYSQDHDNKLPPNLQTLVDAGLIPADMISCQGQPYIYRGADLTISVPPTMIVASDRANAHRGGRNVLFLDGHVEWTNEENFAEFVKKDNEIRRERGLPEKPAD